MTSERSSYIVDNLNFLMAERFHFLYEAKHSRKQWKQFKEIAPEIFNRGNNGSQVIDNQFYGTFTLLNHTYESHFGSFVYQTGGKNKQTNFRHFIAFRLEKPLVSRFSVLSEDPFFEFIGGRKSAFELESNEFNKKFNIAYSTKENHDVYKIMTPLIQEFFLNLQETYGRVNVLFAQDFVLFDFEGNFYSGSGLDFKDFDVDTETFTFFEQKMQTTLYYAQQLLKKLH